MLYEGETVKVFVVASDRAKERFVKAGQKFTLQSTGGSQSASSGQSETHEYAEITEGVKEGDLVVTVGQQNLFEGAKIAVSRQ